MGQAKARREAGLGPRGRRFLFFFFPDKYKRRQGVHFNVQLVRAAGRGLGWARRIGNKVRFKWIVRRVRGRWLTRRRWIPC